MVHVSRVLVPELSAIQKLVLLALNGLAASRQSVQIKSAELGELCSMSKRGVQIATRRLHDLGFIQIIDTYDQDGARQANTYRVLDR